MFCSNCGENIDPQAQFCANCGAASATATQRNTSSLSPAASTEPPVPVEPKSSGKAIFSLVLGILSIPLAITCILGVAAAVPAIVLGHISRSEIHKSMGRLKGAGMATAGLVMGYISVAALPLLLIAVIAIPNFQKAKISANNAAAAATVRTLNTVQITYSTTYPARGYAPDLATLGPGAGGTCPTSASATHACLVDRTLACTSTLWCEKDGFNYSIVGVGSPTPSDYVITAAPVPGQGDKSYCSTADSIVRVKERVVHAPVTAAECASWDPQ